MIPQTITSNFFDLDPPTPPPYPGTPFLGAGGGVRGGVGGGGVKTSLRIAAAVWGGIRRRRLHLI